MEHIIMDCDPGHDDAVAIFMALAHDKEINLLAVSTVCGNNTLEKVTTNAKKILLAAKSTVPLIPGATRPLVGEPIISDAFHGETGMDGPVAFANPEYPIETGGIAKLRDLILAYDKVTLVPTAPLTNIALLLRTFPEVIPHIERISLMGGGLKGGNYTPYGEFNICVDPEAAQIVFSSPIPIIMSGLDVTEKALLYKETYEPLRNRSSLGKFFAELMDFYHRGADKLGLSGCAMHDACSVAYLLQPGLFEGVVGGIDVTLTGERRGETKFISHRNNVTVLTQVNQPAFEALVLHSMKTFI